MNRKTRQSEQGEVHEPKPEFGRIPLVLLHNPKITDGAVRLYGHMLYRFGKNKTNFEGRTSMAEFLDVSETTITNRIAELVNDDWVIAIAQGGVGKGRKTNFYHVFLRQEDCRAYREEHSIPKPAITEKQAPPRKARKGIGGKPTHKPKDNVNSSSHSIPDGKVNSSSHSNVNSSSFSYVNSSSHELDSGNYLDVDQVDSDSAIIATARLHGDPLADDFEKQRFHPDDEKKLKAFQGLQEATGRLKQPDHVSQPGNMVQTAQEAEPNRTATVKEEIPEPPYTSFVSESRNPEPKESSAKEKVAPGDKVYYRYRTGWGGGETAHAAALVCRVMNSKAEIVLVDHKHGVAQCVKKTVDLTSLDEREVGGQYDEKMAAFVEQAEPLTTCNPLPELPSGYRYAYTSERIQIAHIVKDTNYPKATLCGEQHGPHFASKGPQATAGYTVCPECQRVIDGRTALAAKAKAPKAQKPPDAIFRWVCEYLKVDPDVAWTSSRHLAHVLTGYIVREEKHRLGLDAKTPLNDEQRAACAQRLPGFLPWYHKECDRCADPTNPQKFEAWIGKWFKAGSMGITPNGNGKRKADPNCGKCHGSGIETIEDARGYRVSSECSCLQEAHHD